MSIWSWETSLSKDPDVESGPGSHCCFKDLISVPFLVIQNRVSAML